MSELITPLVVVEVPLSALVCKGVSAGYQRRAVRSKKRKMASASCRRLGGGGGLGDICAGRQSGTEHLRLRSLCRHTLGRVWKKVEVESCTASSTWTHFACAHGLHRHARTRSRWSTRTNEEPSTPLTHDKHLQGLNSPLGSAELLCLYFWRGFVLAPGDNS